MKVSLPPLFDHQLDFLEAQERYVLFMGGRGSGKSFVSPMKGFVYAAQHAGATCLMTAPVHKQAKHIVFNPVERILEKLPRGFYKQKGGDHGAEFQLWNGSKILTGNLKNFGYYKSINLDYISIDEFQEIPDKDQEEILSEATLLLRSDFGHKEQLVITCNPTGLQSPLYHFFVTGANSEKWFRSSSSYDNDELSREYVDTLESLPADIKEGYLFGQWLAHEGAIYSVRDNHIIDSPLPQDSNYYLSFDWGFNPDPFVCLLIQEYNGMVHVLDEVTMRKMNHIQLFPLVVKMLADHNVTKLVAMNGDTSEPQSLVKWSNMLSKFSEKGMDLPINGVDKARKNGALAMLEKLEQFNENEIPVLTFSKKCIGTRNEPRCVDSVRSMQWVENEPDKKNPNDHQWDALRYYMMSEAYRFRIDFLRLSDGPPSNHFFDNH